MSNPNYVYTNNLITILIHKPLYGNFVYIRDKHLQTAITKGIKIKVVLPNGEGLIDPKKWIETGKRIEKVFRIPDRPMILYGDDVPIFGEPLPKIKVEKEEEVQVTFQRTLFKS